MTLHPGDGLFIPRGIGVGEERLFFLLIFSRYHFKIKVNHFVQFIYLYLYFFILYFFCTLGL